MLTGDNEGTARRIAGELGPGVEVRWFGLDESIADRLGELQEQDVREQAEYTPPAAGSTDGFLRPVDESQLEILFGRQGEGGAVGPVTLLQRGLAAMINATAATTTARMLLGQGFRPDAAEQALRTVRPPFGRGEVIDADGQPLELVLVKNPAGFTVALSTYGGTPSATASSGSRNIEITSASRKWNSARLLSRCSSVPAW